MESLKCVSHCRFSVQCATLARREPRSWVKIIPLLLLPHLGPGEVTFKLLVPVVYYLAPWWKCLEKTSWAIEQGPVDNCQDGERTGAWPTKEVKLKELDSFSLIERSLMIWHYNYLDGLFKESIRMHPCSCRWCSRVVLRGRLNLRNKTFSVGRKFITVKYCPEGMN